jgi:hypothetical protein
MGQRANELAKEFDVAVNEVRQAIESCAEAHWRSVCNAEGWTVAQTAQHLSGGFPLEMEYVTAAADGRPLPSYSWDEVNRMNNDRAARNATVTQSEVLRELQAGAEATSAYIRALTDDQLDRAGSLVLAKGATVSTQHLIERVVLIDHFRAHLASIRSARRTRP